VTDAQTDAALGFIDRSKDEPFFAWVSEFAPHFPVNDAQARPDLLAKYKAKTPGEDPAKPSYAALTEGVDQSVARIIDYLEATPDPRNGGKPLADNTLVIFTSDNGGEEDPVNSGAFNGPLRGDKGQMYEGGVRVPWIVWSRNADLVRGGGRANDTIVNSTDLYTTLASYARAQLPAGVPLDGIDLKPAFSKGTTINRDHFHHLVSDIGETTDLAAQKPGLVHQLGQQLIAWLDETDAPLATLRTGQSTRVLENFTGRTYANGEVTRHDGDTITITPGEQVPFVLPRP
jgi:arylsulfatase A-like enzyme